MIRSWLSTAVLCFLYTGLSRWPVNAKRAPAMLGEPVKKTRLVTWPAPAGEAASPDYTLAVNGNAVFVYPARVREKIEKPVGSIWTHKLGGDTEWAAFAAFDFEGSVQVEIKPARPFQTATVVPASFGVKPEIKDGVIRFTMDRPRKLTVLLDASDDRPLHLFTSTPEIEVPQRSTPNLIYFGPGVHETGPISVKDGQTVYLAGGAIVRGVILADDKGVKNERVGLVYYPGPVINVSKAEDVRICGRGILEGSRMPHGARNLIGVSQSSDVTVEGIILRDSPNWNIVISQSKNVIASDLKLISGRLNSDGINPTNSTDVTISDCFIRNHDDSIAVKTPAPGVPSSHILAEDNIIWNDWGYALGITYETRSDISDVTFRRCHVIFTKNWVLGVHVVDSGTISGVRFEDITVENMNIAANRFRAMPKLMRVAVASDMWGTDPQRGHIKGIVFHNVAVSGTALPPSEILGVDADHRVEDVRISGLTHNGKPVLTPAEARLKVNGFVDAVQFSDK
jgi:hypothetical protein